jgi:hypothetical protein
MTITEPVAERQYPRWTQQIDRPTASSVRWSAIFAGGVLAIGLQYLVTSLWNALAFSSQISAFADHLAWWQAATSIGALFIGGLVAGWLLVRSGATLGVLHGLAVWGILVTGSVVFGFRSAFPLTDLAQAGSQVVTTQPGSYWPTFVAFGLGAVAAIVGGLLGALAPSPGVTTISRPAGEAVATDDREIDLREPVTTTDRERSRI